MDPAIPRDSFRASLLLVIGEAPVHGYDLPALLAPLGLGTVDRGFLYRTLRLLEADGLVRSTWDLSPVGPARRTYWLTPAGDAWLATATASLRDTGRLLGRWMARYRHLIRVGGPQPISRVPAAS